MAKYFIDKYEDEPSELGPDAAIEITEEDLRCLYIAIMYFNNSKIATKPVVKSTLTNLDNRILKLKNFKNKTL